MTSFRGYPVRILPPGDRLDQTTTTRLAPSKGAVCGCPVTIDLRHIKFIEPFGIIYLYWLIDYLLSENASRVIVEVSGDVRNYLVRMDVPKAFEGNPRVEFKPDLHLIRLFRRDLKDRLVELQTFHLNNDDDVEDLTGKVMDVIKSRKNDIEDLHYCLYLSISELLSNIEVHSGSKIGTLVVQSYDSRVYIAIGDGGIGIPNKLRNQKPEWSDAELIEYALQPQVSSRPGRGGGMGLTILSDAVKKSGTRMVIRSGCGHVFVAKDKKARRNDCAPLPGTIVEVVW